MSPLIPPILALTGFLSLATGFGLLWRDNHARTSLLSRQDALIAQQDLMLEGRDKDVMRREEELKLMAKFVRFMAAKRLREAKEGGEWVERVDGAGDVAEAPGVSSGAFVGGTNISDAQAYPHEMYLATPRTMEDMVRDVMPSLAGGAGVSP